MDPILPHCSICVLSSFLLRPVMIFLTYHQPFRNAASPVPPFLPLTPSIFLWIENYLDLLPWPYQIQAVRSLFLPHFVLCACPRTYPLILALSRSLPPQELLCPLYFVLCAFSPPWKCTLSLHPPDFELTSVETAPTLQYQCLYFHWWPSGR